MSLPCMFTFICSEFVVNCFSTVCTRTGSMAGPIAREEALKKGGADLRFTLSRNDVDDDLQAAFFTNGITTVQKFSSFFRSEDDLIQVMKDSFATDADEGLQARAQLASVICAWRETQTKQKRQAEVEAEMDTREWTKPIPTGDYINLRNAFMRAHGKVEDKVTPSKEYLEKKLQELENGEFRAELLSEVVSKDEGGPGYYGAGLRLQRVALSEEGHNIGGASDRAGATQETAHSDVALCFDACFETYKP